MVGACASAKAKVMEKCSGDYKYVVLHDGVAITKYKGSDKTVEVPEKIDGKKVVAIGVVAFGYNRKINRIIFPDSVTKIGYLAMADNRNLKSVVLPAHLKKLGSNSFAGCKSLESIELPPGLTYLGSYAFSQCKSLKSVKLPASLRKIPSNCFDNCESLMTINLGKIYTIESEAFNKCKKLSGNLNLASVRTLESYAFEDCVGITSVELSNKLVRYGTRSESYAPCNPFAGCTSLKLVNIDKASTNYKSVDGIVYTADNNWIITYPAAKTAVLEYEIPCKCVGDMAYANVAIGKLTIPEQTKYVGYMAFGNASVSEIVITNCDDDCYFNDDTFKKCDKLTTVTFADDIKNLGVISFAGCSALTTVHLPSDLKKLPSGLFEKCKNLVSVNMPVKITIIPENCFEKCKKLASIDLSNIRKIGYNAFNNCRSLAGKLTLNNIQYIGDHAFMNCSAITEVEINSPAEDINIGTYETDMSRYIMNPFDGCSALTGITIGESTRYHSENGILYRNEGNKIVCRPGGKN